MKRFFYSLLAAIFLFTSCASSTSVTTNNNSSKPDVDEITQKALEEWRSEHFGMFIHFGIYSKLAGWWKGEKIPYYGEQIMNHARIPIDEYEAVAREFNPKDFNADEIVKLAKDAGMKYIVMTSKHHDGFCMFHTETTDYNIVDFTPFGRDVVKELSEACQRHGMKFGLYYSLPDWHYP
ncbi:MAG: alpha-L-fucosidase, partial [Bacteroidales bacterium]|nr:alpha-L-fucosidase [Bacteroidales bacterium]